MNKLKSSIQDMRYERMDIGYRYAKSESGRYLKLFEVEERITRNIGWYAEVLSGGGWCNVQRHDMTKVFDSKDDAMDAGLRLPTDDPWRLIDDCDFIEEKQ